ncbi:hypothetical protein DPMN_074780 [Dreissena polymorpha]|uniref:Uncharacterized protein n=2 Tax=Dreissena polymorpha TaxID=45954 RepID=A0A9D3YJ92_DREPO|nr:hypothetical protein DPMN_074780 [Dreissena polymorpha]
MESLSSRIVVVAVFVTIATGLICQFPHCETVKCQAINNCTGSVRERGGGYCGCCPACFTTLGQNEDCEWADPYVAVIQPVTALCDTGLYCELNSSTCQPVVGFG